MPATRVALIGCGDWGRHILRDLVALGCTVEVVARSPRSVANALELGATHIHDDLSRLDAMDVDGVVVATPMETHAVVLGAALALGVPVYCEKPLVLAPAELSVVPAHQEHLVSVMHKWRYHPGVLRLAELLATGSLGEPVGLVTERVQWGEGHGGTDVVFHLAPHDLSIARSVLGALPPVRAVTGVDWGGRLVDVSAVLAGAQGPWHRLTVSQIRHDRRRHVQVVGADGVAWLDDGWSEEVLVAHAVGAEPERIAAEGELPLLAQLRDFVAHLQGGPPPLSSFDDAREEVHRLAEIQSMAASR